MIETRRFPGALELATIAAVVTGCAGEPGVERDVANGDTRISSPGEYAGYSSPDFDGRELTSLGAYLLDEG